MFYEYDFSPFGLQLQPNHTPTAKLVVRHKIDARQRRNLQHCRHQSTIQSTCTFRSYNRTGSMPRIRISFSVVLRYQTRSYHIQRCNHSVRQRSGRCATHEIRAIPMIGVHVQMFGFGLQTFVRPELGNAVHHAQTLSGIVTLPECSDTFFAGDRLHCLPHRCVLG